MEVWRPSAWGARAGAPVRSRRHVRPDGKKGGSKETERKLWDLERGALKEGSVGSDSGGGSFVGVSRPSGSERDEEEAGAPSTAKGKRRS